MGPEKVDTHSIQQTLYNSFALFRRLRLFFSFLFGEFIQVDQGRLIFERLDLLVSFRFTEYI